MVLEAIRYRRGRLEILDQLRLPHELIYVDIKDPQDAWESIKSMQVRGAPAIAIVAILSVAVCLSDGPVSVEMMRPGPNGVKDMISRSLRFLSTSRPTAVNLVDAARKLEAISRAVRPDAHASDVITSYVNAAEGMLRDDVLDNKRIGDWGAQWIEKRCGKLDRKISVVTHCNTGSLATAGYGTALGVIRGLHSRGSLRRVFYTETRPYNQGCRLTGFELLHDEIPAELITDSMASLLLRTRRVTENIFCIIVGADRVVANGDTANKVGTYGLAITARYHGIKFLVAAPRTTIDLSTQSGDDIKIEQRPAAEMTTIKGPEVIHDLDGNISFGTAKKIAIAPKDTSAWNPSFDITPASLIDGIITEEGVHEKDATGSFRLDSITSTQARPHTNGNKIADDIEQIGLPSWDDVLDMDADQVHPWRCWLLSPELHHECALGAGPLGSKR